MSTAASMSLVDLENDPRLFLYTSLTAGSSHIVTATSRMETILKANKIPFQAIDMATDEKAKRLWQRRSGGRKLPGLVKEGFVIGDLNEVEEWNEYGELKQNIGPVPAANAPIPKSGQVGVQIAPPSIGGSSSAVAPSIITPNTSTSVTGSKQGSAPVQGFDKSKGIALPGAEEIKARSEAKKAEVLAAPKPETMTSAPEVKKESIEAAKDSEEKNEAKEQAAEVEKVAEDEKTPATVEGVKDTNDGEKATHESAKAAISEKGTGESISAAVPEEGKPDQTKDEELPGPTVTDREGEVEEISEKDIIKVKDDNTLPEVKKEDETVPSKSVEGLKIAEGANKDSKKDNEGEDDDEEEEDDDDDDDDDDEEEEEDDDDDDEDDDDEEEEEDDEDDDDDDEEEEDDDDDKKPGAEVQKQSAKAPEHAGKSVED